MAVKCPACGFDSPDGASWCDFCKEPFRKKKTAAPQARPERKSISLEELPKEALERLPLELLPGQDGEKVPSAPPWFRTAAWVVLLSILLVVLTMAGMIWARFHAAPR